MTPTYLLDANVLIALTVEEHEHHDRASAWGAGVERVALCPVVEGALVRYLVRVGETASNAARLLRAVYAMRSCSFWPDSLSYVDTDLARVRGHRQVTDAYLVSLTRAREESRLATLDRGLAAAAPDVTTLLPDHP